MELSELLRQVVRILEDLGLRYFVTGSLVTIYFGEPRLTNDVDIVVDLPLERVADLCAAFAPNEFYCSEDSARRAVLRHSQFNIIHPASGLKVDVMVPAATDFNRSRFQRAVRVEVEADLHAYFASIEDAVLMKMEYFRQGGSEKHLRDIAGLFKVSGEKLDLAYLEMWVVRLDLEVVWGTIKTASGDGPTSTIPLSSSE